MTESDFSDRERVTSALKHDRLRSPHSPIASVTCPACVLRCQLDGHQDRGRDYILENAESWAEEDGYAG